MDALSKLSPTITNMIRMDHTHVMSTFHQYEIDTSPGTKEALVKSACLALEIHAQLEEEIFYPAMRSAGMDSMVDERSVPEHEEMRQLIRELRGMKAGDRGYDETFLQLMRVVMHHVADEETVLLPEAERQLADRLEELGAQMTKRRLQLMRPRAASMAYNMVRGMPGKSVLVAAGALLAGTYLVRKSMEGRQA
jgi:hemerythrin superfamily protein